MGVDAIRNPDVASPDDASGARIEVLSCAQHRNDEKKNVVTLQ
jgi:hypothetical protein